MTVGAGKMNRICGDCNKEPIACFNKSGFCGRCWGRQHRRTAGDRATKMANYYKRRNEGGKMLSLCGDRICEEQKRKMRAHPSEMYVLYNKCVKCDVLWPKDTKRCPHCRYPIRMKPRNKKRNGRLSSAITEQGY